MMAEKLTDEDIRRLWLTHFPKWRNDTKSKTLCVGICMMIEQRAAIKVSRHEELIHKVPEILAQVGIAREEFYAVENETSEPM